MRGPDIVIEDLATALVVTTVRFGPHGFDAEPRGPFRHALCKLAYTTPRLTVAHINAYLTANEQQTKVKCQKVSANLAASISFGSSTLLSLCGFAIPTILQGETSTVQDAWSRYNPWLKFPMCTPYGVYIWCSYISCIDISTRSYSLPRIPVLTSCILAIATFGATSHC